MRITAFAPHLAGRMLPGMFSYLSIGLKERFPGDPYADQKPWAAWFWMHTTECGSPNHIGWSTDRQMGAYRFEPEDRAQWPEADWVSVPAPQRNELQARNSQQVLKAERASADATDRETSAIRSPGVGPMGAWQPADAGPQGELFAEAAS